MSTTNPSDADAATDATLHDARSSGPVTARASAPSVGAASAPDGQPSRGDSIGRFVVLGLLGSGGMGNVYSAYDPHLDRKVAIKLLHAEMARSNTADARTRLLREAQAMAKIDHRNVIKVHEVGTLGDHIYVAMEFAEGGTLRVWLRDPHSRRDVLGAFVQAGRGLAAAHAAGLVHRDFKPDNVLLARDGSVRVTDFGLVSVIAERKLARASTAPSTPSPVPAAQSERDLELRLSQPQLTPLSQELTRTGSIMGTPSYMAPEQFAGGESTARTDQFAFCVALYEAVYGERPFAGETFGELGAQVAVGNIRPAPKGTNVPSWLRRVLLRGLASKPEDRYPTMDQLLADLVRDEGARKRTVLAASAFSLLALGATGVLVLRSGDSAVCSGAEARLAPVWGAAQKHDLASAFAAAQRPDAQAVLDRATPIVDRWGHDWQQAYVGACEDTRVRKVQSEHVLDLRMDCLARDLDEAHATLDALAAGGGDAVDHALDAVRALPSVAACADAAALATGIAPAPPEARVAVAAIRSKLDAAKAQRKLARYSKAIAIARAALDEARATKYDPVTGQALLEVGRLQAGLADPKAGDTLAEANIIAIAAGDTETATRAASRRLVVMASKPSMFPVADEINRLATALAAHAQLPPAARVDLDDAAGMLLQYERKQDEAQARYEQALQIATTQLGSDAPDTLVTIQSLGTLAAERHKFADAKKLFDQVLAAQERVVGKDHPDYASALDNVANVMSELGKSAETKELREQALAIRLAALGPDHPTVAKSYGDLAGYYAEAGDYGTAKTYFEKALAIERKAYGEDGVERSRTMENYGLALTDMGDLDGARAMLEKARALREKAYGADDPRVEGVLEKLGLVAQKQKRYDDAIALFQTAQKISEKAFGANDGDVLDTLGDLAATYMAADRLPEAREQMTRLLALVAELNGPNSLRMGLTLGNYGFLQLKLEDAKGAADSFQKAQDIFEAKLGKSHPNLAFTLIGHAQALIQLKRQADALPLLERALEIGNASHIAPVELAEIHFYLADALIANPVTRTRAHSEASTAVSLYEQGHDDGDAKRTKRWLQTH